jgi:hypothetical protein
LGYGCDPDEDDVDGAVLVVVGDGVLSLATDDMDEGGGGCCPCWSWCSAGAAVV